MSIAVRFSPEIVSLLKAVGLIDADGRVDAGWFENPLDRLRTLISNSHQRAALLDLLETVVPSVPGTRADVRWHPLLESNDRGNVYLTIEGERIGLAAAVATPATVTPRARASIRLPLVDISAGTISAIAGTARAPLEVILEVDRGADTRPSLISVCASVDTEGGGSLRVVLENFDAAGASVSRKEFDPTKLDKDTVAVIQALAGEVLAQISENDPMAEHLAGLLGLAPGLPLLPLDRLAADPTALRSWFAEIAADSTALQTWFTHLAGLLGAGLSTVAPQDGSQSNPYRSPILDFGAGCTLDVTLAGAAPTSGAPALFLGIALELPGNSARIEGAATLVALPLSGTSPAAVLPGAHLRLNTPMTGAIVDRQPDIKLGAVIAGIAWDGTRLAPELQLRDVIIAGKPYAQLDLTYANALDAASAAVSDTLTAALGGGTFGLALQALVGLRPPVSDPGTTRRINLAALAEQPTRAIAEVHRAALGDPQHDWSHLFAEVASVIGATEPVNGEGTRHKPWLAEIARHGPAAIALAAWNERTTETPAGTQLLRIGLHFSFNQAPWMGAWVAELLAFDLPQGGLATTRFLGAQHIRLSLAPVETPATATGLAFKAASLSATLDWQRGATPAWGLAADDLVVAAANETVGPVSLRLSDLSFDPSAADLGLGISAGTATALLRLLVAEALFGWGGTAGVTLGALLGLHNRLGGLPADWPLLASDPANAGRLFEDPLGAVRAQMERVLSGISADGTPFILTALPLVRALLADDLPARPSYAFASAMAVAGTGTHEHPWVVPLADGALEALCWMGPKGPPAAWQREIAERVRSAIDGSSLISLVQDAAALLPEAAAGCRGRSAAAAGDALEQLSHWFALSDGVVPVSSQVAVGGAWRVGETVFGAHHEQPSAPAAIAQIRQQLASWSGDGAKAVVLLGPPFADHRAWLSYLQAEEAGRPADAHFDLRAPGIDPLTVDLEHVTAVAMHYTADLAHADLEAMAVQLGRVVSRVKALTAQSRVYLVAHSTAGVVARVFAAGNANSVAGVITLGAPHAGSPLPPLADPTIAEAVRLAEIIQLPLERTAQGRAIAHLAAALDGTRPYPLDAFDGAAVALDPTPGLAIPGGFEVGLLQELANALADRALAVADRKASATCLKFGVRVPLNVPTGDAGKLKVRSSIRADLGQFHLDQAEAGPSTPTVHVLVEVERADRGWLVGDAGSGIATRLRRAELGVTIEAASGGATAKPFVRLYETSAGGSTVPQRDLDDLLAQLPSLPPLMPLTGTRPASGTGEAFLVDALEAVGILVADGTGGLALSLEELGLIAGQPMARLGASLPKLLDNLAAAGVVTRVDGGGWLLQLSGVPIELSIERDPWRLRLRTHDPAAGTETFAFAPGLGLGVDAQIALPTFSSSATLHMQLAAARLAWTGATGALTFAAPPWIEPLTLAPPSSASALRDALGRAIPALAASAVVSGVLNGLLGGAARVRGIERLLASPRAWLFSPDALGSESGGLDPAKITGLLEAVASALGLPAGGGLQFPGGFGITASGSDPLTLSLDGNATIAGPADQLAIRLNSQIENSGALAPSGSVTLQLALPEATWGRVTIALGADAGGISMSVTPIIQAGVEPKPIVLLPRFSGFGALASAASPLLARVLQGVVVELAPEPTQATGLLLAALHVAKALGLYDFDAQGFEAPQRATELGRLLEPDWLASKVDSGAEIAQALAGIFEGPNPLVSVPGTVQALDSTVHWNFPLPGAGRTGVVSARLGWTGPVGSAAPSLTFALHDVQLGPVVMDTLSAGYDQGVACHLAFHLETEGELAFLQPAVDISVASAGFAFEVYPLSALAKDDLTLCLAPEPAIIMSAGGPAALLERWAVPLLAKLLLTQFESSLATRFWENGPSARDVLEASGVIEPGAGSPVLSTPLPPPPAMALGALKALMSNVSFKVTPTLDLTLVSDQGRHGIRLKGSQALGGGDLSLRFGKADWLHDAEAGVTLWLLEDTTTGPLPVQITPALSVSGVGLVLSRAGHPLLDGALEAQKAGGFLFFDTAFLDGARALMLNVSRLGAAAEIKGARVNLSADDGDSFLKNVLPPELQAPFDLAVLWRDGEGLSLLGGTPGPGLEMTFPLDIDLAVLQLRELFLALRTEPGATKFEAALSARASIGPIDASIQRVGLKATLAPTGSTLGFRTPDGIALSIEAGAVSGGGFLFSDEAKGQYAGAIQLHLETLSLAAIGLLNTKLPDGRPIPGAGGLPGFSLLVIIAAEFPPIQLGFGFTLNGIGGLLALNRTINIPALRAGVRTRALDAMLFPPDPIANAAMVVRTLDSIFPIAPNRFVVGPMVRIGWGTPQILRLDLAVLIELPAPIRAVVLGRMRLTLPPGDDLAIIVINLDAVGIINFERGEISIDAVIYDSLLAGFTLTGEMALRARWKDKPELALSVGGFHPSFQTPPDFPLLSRLALNLSSGNNPRLRFEAYLAVTPNTVQFGAAIDLHAEAEGFELDGYAQFDALIYLKPFGLQTDFNCLVSIRYDDEIICGAALSLHLAGPSPWHLWGIARIDVLCLSVTVPIEARIGSASLPPPTPSVQVIGLLEEAIATAANWTSQPPAGEALVTLRSQPGSERVTAHPLGGLTFRQHVAPFKVTLERYGAAPIEGPTRFEIDSVTCGTSAAQNVEDLRDAFAPAQFFSLSGSELLSRPSFEPFVSGMGLRFDGFEIDDLAADDAAPLGYELIVVDEFEDGTAPSTTILDASVAVSLARHGPAAIAATRRPGLRRFEALPATVKVGPQKFGVVAALDGLTTPKKVTESFTEAAEAAERLAPVGEKLSIINVREGT